MKVPLTDSAHTLESLHTGCKVDRSKETIEMKEIACSPARERDKFAARIML